MGQSVIDGFRFGDSYRISELCELVFMVLIVGIFRLFSPMVVHVFFVVFHDFSKSPQHLLDFGLLFSVQTEVPAPGKQKEINAKLRAITKIEYKLFLQEIVNF